LVVSGGHTHLYLARQERQTWHYRNVGRTIDDAAGEAFDKVAKLLGLPYPGGPWIDSLASHGNPRAVPFAFAQIKPKAHRGQVSKDDTKHWYESQSAETRFSFSGIKTAVLRYVEVHNLKPSIEVRRASLAANPVHRPSDALPLCDAQTLDLIASFQHAVVENLTRRTFAAAEHFGAASLLISGGVAANSELRAVFSSEAKHRGIPIAFPSLALATDNAAMIAAAAWPKFVAGEFALTDLSAQPTLPLGRS
jgi:N6-L-threonylcarbamoyladenine synthase